MCPELELFAIVGILAGAVWYSAALFIQGVKDISAGFRHQSLRLAVRGVGKTVAVPFLFAGMAVGGLFIIELLYLC